MDPSKRPILDEFGAAIMSEVRDEACGHLQRLMSAKMKDQDSKAKFRRIAKIPPEHRGLVEELLVDAVDLGIAQFLWFIEQHELVVRWEDAKGKKHDVCAISDGLMGELFTEDGWIARFSKFKDTLTSES